MEVSEKGSTDREELKSTGKQRGPIAEILKIRSRGGGG